MVIIVEAGISQPMENEPFAKSAVFFYLGLHSAATLSRFAPRSIAADWGKMPWPGFI